MRVTKDHEVQIWASQGCAGRSSFVRWSGSARVVLSCSRTGVGFGTHQGYEARRSYVQC